MSKFPAVGQPILAYPDERESYDSDLDPGGETDTGLSKVLRVDLDVGGGTTFTVLVLHLKSQIGDYKADEQRLAQASIVRRLTLPWIKERRLFAVMGDLNADLGSPTLKRVRGWDDVQAGLVQPVYAKSGSTALFT